MKLSNRMIISLLLVLFFLPSLSALWFYYHPSHLKLGQANKGALQKTALQVGALKKTGHWQLVYAPRAACDTACLHALEGLGKIRLALGRHLYGLHISLLARPNVPLPSEATLRELREMGMAVYQEKADTKSLPSASIWLVNQDGMVVLVYDEKTPAKAIFSDLKHLSNLWDKPALNPEPQLKREEA